MSRFRAPVLIKSVVQTDECDAAEELKVSSLHFTFNTKAEWDSLKDCGYLQRTGIQYHWENCGYSSFDDFLMALRQSKRKSIRQERKKVGKQSKPG
jgi:uncharacterized protein